jgi:diaminohydroxyphosphoribosylaminopyrimidine deaminase/5-amino-6-(5-phosphoribosylamino)uracil reductase
MNADDLLYMRRCLLLAEKGRGKVEPNPVVGSVVVVRGQLAGEGWHRAFGGPHAEVHALDEAAMKGPLEGATLYVNLEPCNHFGKTPPCTERIIASGISRVVVGMTDPNPLVSGKGIARLKEAGIEVVSGVGEAEAREINRAFSTCHTLHRPFIVLKWAQTLNGYMGRNHLGEDGRISGPAAQRLVHRWRSELMAIAVGRRTVETDNPHLTTRLVTGRNPLRIILGEPANASMPYHIEDGSVPTLVISNLGHTAMRNADHTRAEGTDLAHALVAACVARGIQSVLVEGGSRTLSRFLSAGLWDEARVISSSDSWPVGVVAPKMPMKETSAERVGEDVLRIYHPAGAAH